MERLFRRRRGGGEGRHRPGKPADQEEFDGELDGGELAENGEDEPGPAGEPVAADYRGRHATATRDEEPVTGTGPWDSRERYPDRPRIDLGCLLLPVSDGQEIQLELNAEQNQVVAASVTREEGRLQLRVLAAPKTSGLWDDERVGTAALIRRLGGEFRETDGPFGPELLVREPGDPAAPDQGLQPARYLGVDGPRWLLCAKITGPAAREPELAKPLEEVLADVVVVRGDHPAPPRAPRSNRCCTGSGPCP